MGKVIIWIIIAVVIILGIYYLISRSKLKSPEKSTIAVPFTGAVSEVTIAGFAFSPQVATIKKGEAIRWMNNDSVNHIVSSDTNAFLSGTISQGGSFEFVFSSIGEFSYHCSIHPSMTGKIIVE
jgi:plastocyanin